MRKYSDEELKDAVAKSYSYSNVFDLLGMRKSGPAHKLLKERILDLGLDTSHFYTKKKQQGVKRGLDEYLVLDGPPIGSHVLKQRLVREGRLDLKCSDCGMVEWRGRTNIFDLDHINGNRNDNRIENLRILCVLCHRITETWGNSAVQRTPVLHEVVFVDALLSEKKCSCGEKKEPRAAVCLSCYSKQDKSVFQYKSVEDTITDVRAMGWTRAARLVGCSDNALRKYLKRNGVDITTVRRLR